MSGGLSGLEMLRSSDSSRAGAGVSAWPKRMRTAALAAIGLAVAGYLAAFELGWLTSVWEPFFGDGSRRVLTSSIARALPVPDALLGAGAYLADIVLVSLGGQRRWATAPWLVLVYGAAVVVFALVALGLVVAQATLVGAFCSLCLTSAAISLLIAVAATEEIVAATRHVAAERHAGASWAAALKGVRPGRHVARRAPGRDVRDRAAPPADATPPAGTPTEPVPTARTTQSTHVNPSVDASSADAPPAATPARAASPASTGASPPSPSAEPSGSARQHRKEPAMSPVVVITGASAGVGRAAVRAFAQAGYDVGLIARGEEGLEAAVREVEAAGQRALALPLDVADADAVEAAAERVERELGAIDVWVNDAMVSVFSPIKEMRPDEYRRVTDVTYLGYVYGSLAALHRMLPRDRGTIVQVGSALGYRSIPLQSAYCAAKHAIIGFTNSLRTELIHDGSRVKVTVVNMPALNTPQFDWVRSRLRGRGQPVPPIFQPEVAARAIVHAAEHPRRELQVGRSTYMAIWGQKFIPGLLDRYLARTGYQAQQTPQPEDPNRPDNLYEPVDRGDDHGAHGRFDGESASWSPALRLTTHRGLVAAVAAGSAVLMLVASRLPRGGTERHRA